MNHCLNCSQPTGNPKFCSKSCSVSYHNRINPKRKKQPQQCKHCGAPITGYRTVCNTCNRSYVDWTQTTIGDYRKKAAYAYQVNAQIRDLARRIYKKSEAARACYICGYDKHTEVCHIKAITEWPDDTVIATINHPTNLVALCPNCHWELDHGLLHIAPDGQ